MEIKDIPTEELQADFKESADDAKLCRIAISKGITEYSGGNVQNRLDSNISIMEKIVEELTRRGL